jgi:hypothetical protein
MGGAILPYSAEVGAGRAGSLADNDEKERWSIE